MNKPSLLYITPVVPDSNGNGLSMRAYSVLNALSSHYAVYLLVISTVSKNQSPGCDVSGLCRGTACLPLEFSRDFQLAARLLAHKIVPCLYARLSSYPMEWMYITPGRLRSAARAFGNIKFDVVHIFRLYMAPYALFFTNENSFGSSQLDLDDIESLTRKRLSGLFALNGDHRMASSMMSEAIMYEEIEKSMLPNFDRVFVCSALDRDRLCRQYQCRRVEVIPNVIQIPAGETKESTRMPFTFLFVGTLNYYPNSEGIIHFCEKVLPLLRKKILAAFAVTVVGDGISRKDAERLSLIKEVNLTGRVQDISPYYRNSHCVLVPIRAGGGTRIKILEAFAYRRPVLSTTVGVEGIDVQHEKHLLIADTDDMFAENCARIMADQALRKDLSENAFHLVKEFYNMELLQEPAPIFLRN